MPWIIGAAATVLILVVAVIVAVSLSGNGDDEKPATAATATTTAGAKTTAPASVDGITYEISGTSNSSLSVHYRGADGDVD